MANRPAIPAEIAREILLESGHRCAVCGTPCPLERAHIIPWHKSREHKPEDLICLCANCHERADKERWGKKVLRDYKERPWVHRQWENTDSMPEPTTRLQVTVDMEIDHFDESSKRWLRYAIAAFLKTSPYDVRIVATEQGSVKVIIELPTESADKLLSAYKRRDPELAKHLAPLILLDLNRAQAGREPMRREYQSTGHGGSRMKARVHSVQELETAIENLLDSLRIKTQADAITFHYYDEAHDRLILPVGVGLVRPLRFTSWLPRMDRVAGKIVKSGKPVVADDAEHHSDMAGPFLYAEGVKSAAGFPLITTTGEKIGVLFVNYRLPHLFSPEERAALKESVTQIADTIGEWLVEAPHLKAELSALAGRRREEAALQEITDSVREALGDIAVAIWIPEERGNELAIAAQSGLQEQATRDARLSFTQFSSVVKAFRTRELVKGSVLEDESFTEEQAKGMRLRTVWAFPILSQSRALGVLCVYPIGYDYLTSREETVVNAFTAQAAATIENQRRILTLTTLHDMGRRLTFTLADPQQLMQEIVANAAWVMGADSVALHQYDPFKREFCTFDQSVTYGIEPYPASEKPREDGVSAYIVEHGLITVSDIDEADPELVRTRRILEAGVKSYLGIRLKADETVVGVLFFNYDEKREFSPDELTIAIIFANYASTAIRNARMYEEIRDRAKDLGVLNEVGRALTSGIRLREDKILELIHSQASKLMDTDNMYIALYDEATDTVRFGLAFMDGRRVDVETEEGWQLRRAGKGRTEEVIRTKRPLLHLTKAEAEKWYAQPGRESYLGVLPSWLGVPMMVGEKVLGVIATYHPTQDYVYSSDDLEILQTMASQAAIALDNAHMFYDVDRRRRALVDFGQAVTSGIRLREDEILELIHEQASELMDTDNMYIALYDEATDILRFGLAFVDGKRVDVETEEDWQPRRTGKGRTGKGKTGEVIRTKQPLFLATKADAEKWHARPGYEKYFVGDIWASWLGVPMMVGERVLGVIATYHPTRDYVYSSDDLEILQGMANQAAIALENAHMFYDVDRRRRALVDFGQAVTSGIRLREDEILELIYSQASNLMDTDNMYVALYDEATDTVRFSLAFVDGKAIDVETRKAGKGRTEEIIHNKEPILISTKAEAEAWYDEKPEREDYLRDEKGKKREMFPSWLGVPMMVGERVLGVIATYHPTREYVYSSNDLEILQGMANQGAIALENAHMFYDVDRRRRALVDFGQAVTSGIRLRGDEILELIYSQASNLMDTDNMYVALYDEVIDTVRFPLAFVDGKAIDVETRRAGKGRTEEIIRNKEPIFISTKAEAEEWYSQPEHREYIDEPFASWLGVPMMVGERVLGVIATYHPTRDYVYSSDDLEILQTMANQAAIALENAHMFYDVDRRRRALVDFGQAVTSGIRLRGDEILELIYSQASNLMETDNMYIALYDEATDTVRFGLALVDGERVDVEKEEGYQPRRAGKGKTEEIIRTKQSLFHATKAEAEAWYAQRGREEYVGAALPSWLGVPMMVGEKALGVIAIYHPTLEYVYKGDDLEILQLMANQAAVAIENTRLLTRETQWAQQLTGLQEIGVRITARRGLEEVLGSIVENANMITAADFSTLFPYDPEQDRFEGGIRKGKVEVKPSIPSNTGFAAHIAKTQQAVFIEHVEKQPSVKPTFVRRKRVKSFAGVPLIIGERTVGVLYVNFFEAHSFSEEEQETIRLLANQAAVAIENARLYAEMEQRVEERTRQLREAQERALAAEVNAAVGLVTAEVAHHSKNLAGIIRACVNRLQQQLQDLTPQQQEDLDNILLNSEGILKAAEDLFKPFRAEPEAEVSVNLMLQEALDVLRGLPDVENIDIQVNLAPDLPRVNVQVQKVTTYITELLNNAVKFTQQRMKDEGIEREQIEVSGQLAEDGFVELTFINHGPAIPSKRWEEIFRLFSAREEEAQEARSYGLGLWGARTTMREHGGDVCVLESNEERTIFLLRLSPQQQEG